MRSLIRKSKNQYTIVSDDKKVIRLKVEPQKVAQCCAKVSKSVAGCHD